MDMAERPIKLWICDLIRLFTGNTTIKNGDIFSGSDAIPVDAKPLCFSPYVEKKKVKTEHIKTNKSIKVYLQRVKCDYKLKSSPSFGNTKFVDLLNKINHSMNSCYVSILQYVPKKYQVLFKNKTLFLDNKTYTLSIKYFYPVVAEFSYKTGELNQLEHIRKNVRTRQPVRLPEFDRENSTHMTKLRNRLGVLKRKIDSNKLIDKQKHINGDMQKYPRLSLVVDEGESNDFPGQFHKLFTDLKVDENDIPEEYIKKLSDLE